MEPKDNQEKRSLRERLKPRERSLKVKWCLTIGLLLCSILGLHLLCQMLGTLDFSRMRFSSYFHAPIIFLLNLLPVALLIAFTYFATNRAWLGFLIPAVLLTVMEFVNYFKVVLRGDPFIAEVFLLIGEGAGIIGQYELHFPAWFFISLVLIIGGTVVLLRYAKGRIPKRLWWVRVLALALCVGFGAISWVCWYSDETLYEKQENHDCFNVWHEAEYNASHGFLWSFLRSVDEVIPDAHEGYSEEAAQALLAPYTDAAIPENKRVNVVATMLESYTDLSAFGTVNFTVDPYAEFHALQDESYHGTLLSDTVGGGTINAERSFLTGYAYPQPRYRSPSSSFVRYFKANGYRTEGAHPGFDWFYSRKTVNERLGFDNYLFMENYFNDLTDEEHAPDDVFFPAMARLYDEQTAADDTPCFSFSVSYQNHSPYDGTQLVGEEYVPHEGLSDEAYYLLNNYLSGVADTGKQVAAYVDTFRDNPEPVVLVFFGDHKPSFGAGNCYYEELGISAAEYTPEGCWSLFTTPYLIWANDAAKEVLGFDFTGEGRTISPAYLMAELFDCCGWAGPQWMQYQRSVRDALPVMQRTIFFLVDGVLTRDMPPEREALYREYLIAEYYMQDHLHTYDEMSGG